MRPRQFHHGTQVVLKILLRSGTGVAGHIVGPRHDVHDLRMQVDDILEESQ